MVAAYDDTEIRIELRGRGKEESETMGGHKIGDVFKVRLDKGQTYMIRGTGKTRGVFDLSGSLVTSDKPIGLLSFHMRCTLPSWDMTIGYDHIIEMMPPVTAWGKKYVTVEYKRDTDKGDFFRIVGCEANTNWNCKYYDKNTGDILGNYGGTLKNPGDFDEYLEIYAQPGSPGIQSIRGTSIWTADKPVIVMQYTYSHYWDYTTYFDPFVILVVPEEQFTQSTVFQTPSSKQFRDNWFNIIAVHDSTDLEMNDLRSITLDGQPIWSIESTFLMNRIPTTDMYWAKLHVGPGAHRVESDTRFSGYIYGFTRFDSYGWPAAMNINKLDETDTLEPVLTQNGFCGDFEILATELRNGGQNDDPRQVDQGINDIQLLSGSFNYEFVFDTKLVAWPPLYEYSFRLEVIDHMTSGKGIYAVTDRAGNVAIDSVLYHPDSLEIAPQQLSFGPVRIGTSKRLKSTIRNLSKVPLKISEISLAKGQFYAIVDGKVVPADGLELPSTETWELEIEYSPKNESEDQNELDIDSIVVTTECLEFKAPIDGRGVIPRIEVADWDAGSVSKGKTFCKAAETGQGLKIENRGTDTLTVFGVENVSPPFSISDPTNPPFPFRIAPNETVYLEDICFEAIDTNEYDLDVTFNSDGMGPDSISHWHGKGISPGPFISSMDWGERRILTENDGTVKITNHGNHKVRIVDVELDAPNPNFSIDKAGITPGFPAELHPEGTSGMTTEIIIPVNYTPQDEQVHHAEVVGIFDDPNISEGDVPNGNLDGIGILPKLKLIGHKFEPSIPVNTLHPETGVVRLISTSTSSDLKVISIAWEDPSQAEFTWVSQPPQDFILPMGDTLDLQVRFRPNATNYRSAAVIVECDAAPGPKENPTVDRDTLVEGDAYDTGVTVEDLVFEDLIICDTENLASQLTNKSTTKELTIDDVVLVSGDVLSFKIESFPQTIPADDFRYVTVSFEPAIDGSFHALARVYYQFQGLGRDSIDFNIDAIGYVLTVDFDLPEIQGIPPGGETQSPQLPDFPVLVKCDDWKDADIKSFEIELVYNARWMKWTGDPGGAVRKNDDLIDNSWTVTATESVEPMSGMAKLTISGSGSTAIRKNGELVYPVFLVLLDNDDFQPDFGKISFPERDECVLKNTNPGSITIAACVKDLRSIVSTGIEYQMQEIEPNPVESETFSLKYSVGLDGNVAIDIFSASGEKCLNVINRDVEAGEYEQTIETGKLNSGTYFVRMQSGPFSDVKRLVITK